MFGHGGIWGAMQSLGTHGSVRAGHGPTSRLQGRGDSAHGGSELLEHDSKLSRVSLGAEHMMTPGDWGGLAMLPDEDKGTEGAALSPLRLLAAGDESQTVSISLVFLFLFIFLEKTQINY